jgi:hypothetical protein
MLPVLHNAEEKIGSVGRFEKDLEIMLIMDMTLINTSLTCSKRKVEEGQSY